MVIESQTKSLKFITGIKTDIELTQDMQSKMQQQGAGGKDGRSLPVRTPSGRDAQSDNGTVSKWQKKCGREIRVSMSSLCRGHANLLCICPVYSM